MKLVPSHVRYLQAGVLGKMHDLPLERAESLHSGRFFTRLEKQLVAEADPEIGQAIGEPSPDEFPKPGLAKLPGTVPERPDARHDQSGTSLRIDLAGDMNDTGTRILESTLDAAQIPAAVIY